MKLDFSLFNESMAFDKSSGFVKQVISPKTGSKFSLSSRPNDPVMKILYSIKGPTPKGTERVLRIPLRDRVYDVVVDKEAQVHYISIGGKRPRPELISIRGPRPRPKPDDTKGALTIKLDSRMGRWYVRPNPAGDVLNISFNGPKKGGSPLVK